MRSSPRPPARRAQAWLDFEVAHQTAIDGFQVHYYGPWEGLADSLPWLRSVGLTLPVEVWELGRRYAGQVPFSEAGHAAETARSLLTGAGEGSALTVLVRYHAWPDKHLPGLVTESGRTRPAETAYRVVRTHLVSASDPHRLDLGPGAWGYRFSTPAGPLDALWSTGGATAVVLPGRSGRVQVHAIDGTSTTVDARSMPIDDRPVLVPSS